MCNRMRTLLIIFLLNLNFVFGQSFEYPKIKSSSYLINDFIPTNWKILDSVSGDLNSDKLKDYAIVFEKNDSIEIIDNQEKVKTKPRILAILFKQNKSDKFELVEQSNTFILNHPDNDMEEPFESIKIYNGKLIIDFHLFHNIGSWYINNVSYEFKFMRNDFYLINAMTNSFHRATHDFEEYKYDFLNKTWTFTKLNESSIENTKKTENYKFDKIELKTIKTIKEPYSWEVTKDNYL